MFELVGENFLGESAELQHVVIALCGAELASFSFERRCSTVKNEDGFDVEEEQFTASPKHAQQVSVGHAGTVGFPHGFDELGKPNGGINRELLVLNVGVRYTFSHRG